MFRVYELILDDGQDVFKCLVPAKDVADACSYVRGNGEVVRCLDVTEKFPIDLDNVFQALNISGNFSRDEINIVIRALARSVLNTI